MQKELEKEDKKRKALKLVEDAYYDIKSIHFVDNERFKWAVDIINQRFNDDDYV